MSTQVQPVAIAAATLEPDRAVSIANQIALDLYDCSSEQFDDIDWVRSVMLEAATIIGATIVETVFHKFAPWGISGVVVISESHIAIHTWPERRFAAVDIFTCSSSMDFNPAVRYLTEAFRSRRPNVRRIPRGERLA